MHFRWLSMAIIAISTTSAHASEGVPLCGGHDMGGPAGAAKGQPGGHQHSGGHEREREPEDRPPPPAAQPTKTFKVEVTEKGFVPAQLEVKAKEWVEITLVRTTDKTCARRVIFELGGTETIQYDLPLKEPVTFRTRFERPGTVPFACQMKMVSGTVLVR